MKVLYSLISLLWIGAGCAWGSKESKHAPIEEFIVLTDRQIQLLSTPYGSGVETIAANTPLNAISIADDNGNFKIWWVCVLYKGQYRYIDFNHLKENDARRQLAFRKPYPSIAGDMSAREQAVNSRFETFANIQKTKADQLSALDPRELVTNAVAIYKKYERFAGYVYVKKGYPNSHISYTLQVFSQTDKERKTFCLGSKLEGSGFMGKERKKIENLDSRQAFFFDDEVNSFKWTAENGKAPIRSGTVKKEGLEAIKKTLDKVPYVDGISELLTLVSIPFDSDIDIISALKIKSMTLEKRGAREMSTTHLISSFSDKYGYFFELDRRTGFINTILMRSIDGSYYALRFSHAKEKEIDLVNPGNTYSSLFDGYLQLYQSPYVDKTIVMPNNLEAAISLTMSLESPREDLRFFIAWPLSGPSLEFSDEKLKSVYSSRFTAKASTHGTGRSAKGDELRDGNVEIVKGKWEKSSVKTEDNSLIGVTKPGNTYVPDQEVVLKDIKSVEKLRSKYLVYCNKQKAQELDVLQTTINKTSTGNDLIDYKSSIRTYEVDQNGVAWRVKTQEELDTLILNEARCHCRTLSANSTTAITKKYSDVWEKGKAYYSRLDYSNARIYLDSALYYKSFIKQPLIGDKEAPLMLGNIYQLHADRRMFDNLTDGKKGSTSNPDYVKGASMMSFAMYFYAYASYFNQYDKDQQKELAYLIWYLIETSSNRYNMREQFLKIAKDLGRPEENYFRYKKVSRILGFVPVQLK